MASLTHRGMIHPMSIVYKRAEEFRAGDTVILGTDEWGSPAKVFSVSGNSDITFLTVEGRDYRLGTSYKYVLVVHSYFMLRIPPVNPRVMYHD